MTISTFRFPLPFSVDKIDETLTQHNNLIVYRHCCITVKRDKMVRKLQNFQVIIDGNKEVFYSGDQVSGAVIVDVTQLMKCNMIKVKLEGLSYCHWTTTRQVKDSRGNSRTHTDHHTGTQRLVDLQAILFGGTGSSSVRHPPGRHVYRFTFQLPSSLPSSFEGGTGHIRYIIEAKVDRPWKFDHKIRKPFTVNEIIDINLPHYLTAPSGTKQKEIGCLCCVAGNVNMQASLDRSGYCPGEQIFLHASCENNSTRELLGMRAKLVQNINYHANDGRNKSYSKEIAHFNGQRILERSEDSWDYQPFLIPAVPPTIQTTPVRVSYHIKFEVGVPFGFNPKILLDITIGTVPFRQSYGRQSSYQLAENQYMGNEFSDWVPPTAPTLPSAPPPNAPGYPDMPPPSYAAAIGSCSVDVGDTEAKSYFGDQSYVPMYTYAQPYQTAASELPPSFASDLPSTSHSTSGTPYPGYS